MIFLGDIDHTNPVLPFIGPPVNVFQYAVLNNLREGTAMQQRQGNRVAMKSIELRMSMVIEDVLGSGLLRMVLVYDRQPNGAVPTWADIFSASSYNWSAPGFPAITGVWPVNTGLEPPNINNKDRFLILLDEQFYFHGTNAKYFHNPGQLNTVQSGDPTDLTETDNPWNYHRYVKLSGLESVFKGNAAGYNDVSGIATGALYFIPTPITMTNDPGFDPRADAWTNTLRWTISSRLRFYET